MFLLLGNLIRFIYTSKANRNKLFVAEDGRSKYVGLRWGAYNQALLNLYYQGRRLGGMQLSSAISDLWRTQICEGNEAKLN